MANRSVRAALVLFPVAAVLATASCSSAPQDFTVHGTVEVAVQSYERPLSLFDRNLLGKLESDLDREPVLATVLRGMARHRSPGEEAKKK